MSDSRFGVSARLRSRSIGEVGWRLLGALVAMVACLSALVWWNGLLEPHEIMKQLILVAGGVCLFTVGAVFNLRAEERPLPLVLWILVWALVVSSIISCLVSPDRWVAWLGTGGSIASSLSVTLCAIGVFMLAAQLRVAGWKGIPRVSMALLSVTILISLAQLVGWIDLSPGGVAARVFSPLGNGLVVGWVAVLLLPWLLFQETDDAWWQYVTLALAVVWLAVLDRPLLWITAGILLFMGQALAWRWGLERSRSRIWISWAVFVLMMIGWAVPIPRPNGLPQLVAPSWQQSWQVTREAWTQDGAIFGAGQGQWQPLFERVRTAEMNIGERFLLRFESGTSWLLTASAQEGVAGLVLRTVFLLLLLLHVFLLAHRHPERLPLALSVLAGTLLVTLMFPHSWLLVGVFGIFGYAAGDAYDWPRGSVYVWSGQLGWLALIGAVSLIWLVPRFWADHTMRQALRVPLERRGSLADQANQLAAWVPEYAFAAVEDGAAQTAQRLQQGIADPALLQQQLAHLLGRAKGLTDRWPTRAEAWLARGKAYAAITRTTQGADQFAIQAYQEGMSFAPQNPAFPLGIAQVYVRRAEEVVPAAGVSSTVSTVAAYRIEQRRLAAQWLQRALELKPDDVGLVYLYAVNLAQAGDAPGAVRFFNGLTQRFPDRIDLRLEYATLLAATNQRREAIRLTETIPSSHELYTPSRRLLTDWYAAEKLWPQAVAAWQQLPAEEQKTSAFRTRLRELQSKANSAVRR